MSIQDRFISAFDAGTCRVQVTDQFGSVLLNRKLDRGASVAFNDANGNAVYTLEITTVGEVRLTYQPGVILNGVNVRVIPLYDLSKRAPRLAGITLFPPNGIGSKVDWAYAFDDFTNPNPNDNTNSIVVIGEGVNWTPNPASFADPDTAFELSLHAEFGGAT